MSQAETNLNDYTVEAYPNPFNPNTRIRYNVPQNSYVQIKIFDILGNEVKILVNKEKEKGWHEINFNATNLSSGTYFLYN